MSIRTEFFFQVDAKSTSSRLNKSIVEGFLANRSLLDKRFPLDAGFAKNAFEGAEVVALAARNTDGRRDRTFSLVKCYSGFEETSSLDMNR